MSDLMSSVEHAVETDFALLFACQEGAQYGAETMTYAASAPGVVAMACGTKYARMVVRLERWDGPPPPAENEWEDCDELPWQTLPDQGRVLVAGFDPPDEGQAGLSLEGFDRGRVQVLAQGRHRYSYSEDTQDEDIQDEVPPERWLLRWWPTAGPPDAMLGPPRRIAGPLPFQAPTGGWAGAIHASRQTGWDRYLLPLEGFREILSAVAHAGRACSAEELTASWGPWGTSRQQDGPYRWEEPVLGRRPALPMPHDEAHRHSALRQLAQAASMPQIETFRDALTALFRLGLLARCDAPRPGLMVVNPAPQPVWDVLEVSQEHRHELQTSALNADYQHLEEDLLHLLRWAEPAGLTSTPHRVAVRLAVAVQDVLGTIRLVTHLKKATVDSPDARLGPDSTFTLRERD